MCLDCNKVLKKFKGAIISAAAEHFRKIKVQLSIEDFMAHIRVKYFIAKENNNELINVTPSYFYSIARNLKKDFNNQSNRTINLEFEQGTIFREKFNRELNQIDITHSNYVNEQLEKDKKNKALIKILKECKDYVSEDEFNAIMSVYKEETLKEYQIRNNFSKTNSALIARKRFIAKAAQKIREKYPNGLGL